MIRRRGRVATPEASRWLARLCHHFSRKIEVASTERDGVARFPWGVCRMAADDAGLAFDCEAEDAERLARVQYAIDAHVRLFSRKHPLEVEWEAPVEVPG